MSMGSSPDRPTSYAIYGEHHIITVLNTQPGEQ